LWSYINTLFCSDLAETFEGQLKRFFQQDWVAQLLREARTSRHYESSTKETSRWAKEVNIAIFFLIIIY
jgi:ribosomal protein S21